jgi:hypothetical protein
MRNIATNRRLPQEREDRVFSFIAYTIIFMLYAVICACFYYYFFGPTG